MGTGFRPPQWSQQGKSATLTLLVPPTNGAVFSPAPGQSTLVVFDGTIRANHELDVAATENPVQTGATITDHAFLIPVKLTVEIAMSDSMQSFVVGQFSSNPSRSVAAFQFLEELRAARVLVTISTRLAQYDNMLLVSVRPEEENATRFALRCSCVFQQILLATIQQSSGNPAAQSARPQTTATAVSGQGQLSAVSSATTQNNNILNAPKNLNLKPALNIKGAGIWSGVNVNSLGNVFPPD